MTKNPPFRLKNYPLSIINIIVNNFDENPLMMETAYIRALNSIVAETESKRVRRKSLAPIFWNISPTRRSIQEEWEEEGSKKGAWRAFDRANLIQDPNLVFSILHAKRRAAFSSSSSFIGFFLRSRCKLFKKLFLVHAIRERERERNYFLLRFWVYMEI